MPALLYIYIQLSGQFAFGGGGGNRTPVHSILLQLLRIKIQEPSKEFEGLAL